MFNLDVPIISANDAPLILAQQNSSDIITTSQNEPFEIAKSVNGKATIFTFCRDMFNHATGIPQKDREVDSISATNFFSPSTPDIVKMLGARKGDLIEVSILEKPKHGNLYPMRVNRQVWGYLSEDGYAGHDRVVFTVAYNDKKLKVVVNLLVTNVTGEEYQYCANEKFSPISQYQQLLPWSANLLLDLPNSWQTRSSIDRLITSA